MMPFLKQIEEMKIRQDTPESLKNIILDFGYGPARYYTIASWEWDMIIERVYRDKKSLLPKALNMYNFYQDLKIERARRGKKKIIA